MPSPRGDVQALSSSVAIGLKSKCCAGTPQALSAEAIAPGDEKLKTKVLKIDLQAATGVSAPVDCLHRSYQP